MKSHRRTDEKRERAKKKEGKKEKKILGVSGWKENEDYLDYALDFSPSRPFLSAVLIKTRLISDDSPKKRDNDDYTSWPLLASRFFTCEKKDPNFDKNREDCKNYGSTFVE